MVRSFYGIEHFELSLTITFQVITRLGKRLDLRQQVIATAIVYFRRFYLRSSYCETDPFFVAAACCYVAAKVEESPCHLKSVVSEARSLFGCKHSWKAYLRMFTLPLLSRMGRD